MMHHVFQKLCFIGTKLLDYLYETRVNSIFNHLIHGIRKEICIHIS